MHDVPQHVSVELLQHRHIYAPGSRLQRTHVPEVSGFPPERDLPSVPVTDHLDCYLFLVYYATLSYTSMFAAETVKELSDDGFEAGTSVRSETIVLNVCTEIVSSEDGCLVTYHRK